MIAKIAACALIGLDGYPIEVEGDVSYGMPAFDIVGLPDASVKEAKERVKAAIRNCGFEFNSRRITINLAPATIRKEGSVYDLAIAIAILCSDKQITANCENYLFLGELSLAGELRPVTGVLPACVCAAENNIKNVIVPIENVSEAALVQDINVFGAKTLYDVTLHIEGKRLLTRTQSDAMGLFSREKHNYNMCFSEVKGQDNVKRALAVAASGAHNCLIIGSPGSGKSMLAKRLPTILPDLNFEEALEVTKIHSISGLLDSGQPLISTRPFRSPHHSISNISLVGGGSTPRPGEMSLAHNGVLFLDELPEFKRDCMEVMRQPLEDGTVTISRVAATLTYPCNVMLIAAMNPCRCGYYGDPTRKCRCKLSDITKYLAKISGPLLDRLDIQVEAASVSFSDLQGPRSKTSQQIRYEVATARAIQEDRYRAESFSSNSALTGDSLEKYCTLTREAHGLIASAFNDMNLSARGYSRILKVSRTIADLAGKDYIDTEHICEAIQYRSLDKKFWGM